MINTTDEVKYYAAKAHENARIASALSRKDVLEVIAQAPDTSNLSAFAESGKVVITLTTWLEGFGEIAEIANYCNGSAYVLDQTVTVLDRRGVEVRVNVNSRQPLTDDEKDLLRSIGKLQPVTHETLVCSA